MRNVKDTKKTFTVRIAGMLDELSENFFPYECDFLNLNSSKWKEEIEAFEPDILFVESIWNGYKGTWRSKLLPSPSEDFLSLMDWCKQRQLPTVFWNKEDPVHFTTFMHIASHFDYVLTTDFDCVPLYKRLLGHDQVFCMPFASSVQMYSPLEKYERTDGTCFAGSYYNKREERKKDFENIVDVIDEKEWKIDIYDRNPYPNNPEYTYPKKYQKYIVGTLPPDQVDIAYKSYKFGITLNIVKHSSTMQARRAFELISCNTLVLSNECLGLRNLFGDLIVYFDNKKSFENKLENLSSNELLFDKTRLLALRKVLKEHTYKERIGFIYQLVFKKKNFNEDPFIGVYSVINNIEEYKYIKMSFKRQNYGSKKLYLFSENDQIINQNLQNFDCPLQVENIKNMNESFLDGLDFVSYFDVANYYGDNFLTDLVLSLKYEPTATVVGKGSYYYYDQLEVKLKNARKKYTLTTSLRTDRSIVNTQFKKSVGFDQSNNEGSTTLEGVTCLSVDPFNFCENYTLNNCEIVDDIPLHQGVSLEDINKLSILIESSELHYSYEQSISKEELFNIVRSIPGKIGKSVTTDNDTGIFTLKDSASPTTIHLQRKFMLNELDDEIIVVYLNALIQGKARIVCTFFDQNDQGLGGCQLLTKGCTSIRIKERAHYYKFSIELSGLSQIVLKEIMINPQPKNNLLKLYNQK